MANAPGASTISSGPAFPPTRKGVAIPALLPPTQVLTVLGAIAPPAPGGQEWRIEGGQAGARLGSALATADVDGDGYGDLLVGAPG